MPIFGLMTFGRGPKGVCFNLDGRVGRSFLDSVKYSAFRSDSSYRSLGALGARSGVALWRVQTLDAVTVR